MSEPAAVRGIVVAHGNMGAGLVDAVREITGLGPDVLAAITNKGVSPDALTTKVRGHVSGPTIVFTDLQSGSCGFAARRCVQDLADVVVVSGVNLPMLLEFVMYRNLPMADLVPRLLSRARSAIASSPVFSDSYEHRAASGG